MNSLEKDKNTNTLCYSRLEICIEALEDTCFDAWAGAFLRANLKVAVKETDAAAYVIIFPENKPIGISIALPKEIKAKDFVLHKGAPFTFDILLIGSISEYFMQIIEAVRTMCQKGMGHPRVPFSLLSINEISFAGTRFPLFAEGKCYAEKLHSPISYADFFAKYYSINECKEIAIFYDRPLSLFKPEDKKNKTDSYQDKLNGFPGLYSLVQKALNRMYYLSVTYCGATTQEDFLTAVLPEILPVGEEKNIANALYPATYFALSSCEIFKSFEYKETPEKETDRITTDRKKRRTLDGYVGQQKYLLALKNVENNFSAFLPALKMTEALGVGNKAIYGLDRYRIEMK